MSALAGEDPTGAAVAQSNGDGGAQLQAQPPPPARQRIEAMSGEVVDSNPYSRLMALQRMGIVKNYADIRNKTVCIGSGGWGVVGS